MEGQTVTASRSTASGIRALLHATERDQVFAALFHVPVERQRLGRYVVLGTLGRGGMGTVLEAFDRTLDRRVAVKVLHRGLTARHQRRLLREAQAMAKLSHPHVVQVYEAGEIDGQTFIAMELVRGRMLSEWMNRSPRPDWRACVEVFVQAGSGLAAAHAQGLVHRDFKPGNAIVDEDGRARVLDFGLARRVACEDPFEDPSEGPGVEDATLVASLTRTGAMMGTPAYMSLEQMTGGYADARSDQFSFCASLYEAVYGQRPYAGRTLADLRDAMLQGALRSSPRGSKVPADLRKALVRGLSPDPERRWPSMDALLAELRRVVAPPARRWRLVTVAVAGGLLAVGLGLWQYAQIGFRCEGSRRLLDGIWDDARKREVRAALLGTELSYAANTWQRVEHQLDGYSDAWVAKHTEVCEATRVTQEQSPEVMDLRMACLSGRRLDLRATVDVLAQTDRARAEKAVDLVASVPTLARCDDLEALRAQLPPPEDEQVRARVEAIRPLLAESRAQSIAGDYQRAAILAGQVLEQARPLGYGPLSVEALTQLGAARHILGELERAQRDLEEAFHLALELDHRWVQQGAANELADLLGGSLGRLEDGTRWGRLALALSRREDTPGGQRASALSAMGRLRGLQREADALDYFRQALLVEQEASGADHPDVAAVLNDVGTALLEQRHLDEALDHFRRAHRILVEAYGPRHPSVASSSNNIGRALEVQGHPGQALEHYQRALEVLQDAYGPHHQHVAVALNNVGKALEAQGELARALPYYQRALATKREGLGARHFQVAVSLVDIGNVLLAMGDARGALEHYRQSIDITRETLGPEHPAVGGTTNNIGDVLARQGRWDEAREHYQRALSHFERAFGPDHPDLAIPLLGLTRVALEQDEPDAARAHGERAVSLREAGEVSPGDLALARFMLARALWSDPMDRARAHGLARRAREGLADRPETNPAELAEVDAWLRAHPLPRG